MPLNITSRWLQRRRRKAAQARLDETIERAAKLGITPERVLEEYRRIAFANLSHIVHWGDNGMSFKPDGELDPEDVAAICEIVESINWLSIEYLDAANSHNPQVIATFDQGAIDAYGLRTQPSVQAHSITNPTSATVSAQLTLQRRLYLRNTYKFKLGWRYALLEPMDIVLISDAALGLSQAAVRITQIEEDQNGELTITAEEIPGVTP